MKTVATSKAAYELKAQLETKLGDLATKLNTAKTYYAGATATSLYRDAADKKYNRYTTKPTGYILEEYAQFATNTSAATLTNAGVKWLLDNGYVATYQASTGINALVAAFKPVTESYQNAVVAEKEKLENAVYDYTDKYAEDINGVVNKRLTSLTVADLEGMDALEGQISDFNTKYCGLNPITVGSDYKKALAYVVGLYYSAYDNELLAVPGVEKLTDADKATVLALAAKYDALGDDFETKYANLYENKTALEIGSVESAYTEWLDAAVTYFAGKDVTAYDKLDTFTVLKDTYFDNSEKNVKALEAKRAAFDELVANYGYDVEFNYMTEEAKILAAEHNMKAAAGFDEKNDKIENSKVVAYLNNATVTVKSTKLAAKKVRVQAKVDSYAMSQIIEALGDGGTVEYKFYHKAPGKSFKLTKTKGVNYITYTSKSLKKGKNSFRVGIVLKDAKGNVVATKDYQASSLAYRTIK